MICSISLKSFLFKIIIKGKLNLTYIDVAWIRFEIKIFASVHFSASITNNNKVKLWSRYLVIISEEADQAKTSICPGVSIILTFFYFFKYSYIYKENKFNEVIIELLGPKLYFFIISV